MNHFTTIKDIARELNISVSTVSRALRDTYDVSRETKGKVLAVASQLKYRPNFNAIGLVNGKTFNIGIILPFVANHYFSTVVTGIQEVAYMRGFNIILFLTNDSPEREIAVLDNLSISALDGLLVCVSSQSDANDHFKKVIELGLPVVFFDRANSIKTSRVMQDDFKGSFMGVEHLVKSGYRRIAHIAGPKGMLFTERRRNGYIAALRHYNLPVRDEYMVHSGFDQESGLADTYQLLSCKEPPDAIFAVNDRKAMGAILALKKEGIRIGSDIGVVGFTNDPVSSLISPSLTTISEPAFEIGKQSCELLLKHIRKKHYPAEEIILPTQLIVRESSRKVFD